MRKDYKQIIKNEIVRKEIKEPFMFPHEMNLLVFLNTCKFFENLFTIFKYLFSIFSSLQLHNWLFNHSKTSWK